MTSSAVTWKISSHAPVLKTSSATQSISGRDTDQSITSTGLKKKKRKKFALNNLCYGSYFENVDGGLEDAGAE